MVGFTVNVCDAGTCQPVEDTETIVLCEDWAKNLIYDHVEGFALTERGQLFIYDSAGNIAYPPEGRF